MNETVREIERLVQSLNVVSGLIRETYAAPRQTPTQTERVRHWQRVRSALHRDIKQLEQKLPGGVQLTFGRSPDLTTSLWWYYRLQQDAYDKDGANDPLNERAEGRSTLSGEVS